MGPALLLLATAARYQPWGESTFEQARSLQQPVLLLVSEDAGPEPGEASLEGVVAVVVDPVERPDVADLYRTAASLLPEASELPGGPLMYLLTPEGRPFAAAPSRGASLAPFLARGLAEFNEQRSAVDARAGTVVALLREAQRGEAAASPLDASTLARALAGLADAMDPVRGGFRSTPKAPPHGALRLLIEEAQRTRSAEAVRLLEATLDGMANGEILGPEMGFYRQAAQEDWGRPSGGQRLPDNALLLRAYSAAYTLTGRSHYRLVADRVASFSLHELRGQDGTFIAARRVDGWAGTAAPDARVVAGWNGLMISGLAASGRKEDLAAAGMAASAVLERLGPAALLRRIARGEELGGSALLEDYAYLAEGLIDLAEATGEARWNEEAAALIAVATSRFLDADRGGFYDTDERHGAVPVRIRNGYDGDLPSANGVMASALLKLARASGETRHAVMARRTVDAFLGDLQKAPRGLETLAAAAGELLGKGEAAGAADPVLPARATRGPVTLEATLSAARVSAGATLEARLVLTIADGYSVNPRSPGKDLQGLSVSVPGEDFVASPPRYPEPVQVRRGAGLAPAYAGTASVTVPLRVRAGRRPGETRVRLRVGFQACDPNECRAPDSAVLDVPLTIVAAPRAR